MVYYTSETVAGILGVSVRTVTRYCVREGIEKFGRSYKIPENKIECIKNHTHEAPGNPNWSKNN